MAKGLRDAEVPETELQREALTNPGAEWGREGLSAARGHQQLGQEGGAAGLLGCSWEEWGSNTPNLFLFLLPPQTLSSYQHPLWQKLAGKGAWGCNELTLVWANGGGGGGRTGHSVGLGVQTRNAQRSDMKMHSTSGHLPALPSKVLVRSPLDGVRQ